jgi:hypothetical protein
MNIESCWIDNLQEKSEVVGEIPPLRHFVHHAQQINGAYTGFDARLPV